VPNVGGSNPVGSSEKLSPVSSLVSVQHLRDRAWLGDPVSV